MYILKKALISIKRNKGRNILLVIVIAVIAFSCAISLSIRSAANKIVNSYEEENEIETTISMNRRQVMNEITKDSENQEDKIEKFNEIKSLTLEEIEEYGNSKYLKNYYYTYSTGMNSNSLEEATDFLKKETTTTTTKEFPGKQGMGERFSTIMTTKEIIKNANLKKKTSV